MLMLLEFGLIVTLLCRVQACILAHVSKYRIHKDACFIITNVRVLGFGLAAFGASQNVHVRLRFCGCDKYAAALARLRL